MPALKAILDAYPYDQYDRTLITDCNGVELVRLDSSINYINLVEVNGGSFIHNLVYRAKVLRQIKMLKLDTLFDAALLRRIEGNDAIVRASGAKAVGFHPQPDQPCEINIGNYSYYRLVDDPRWSTHEILRYLYLIGKTDVESSNVLPIIDLPNRPKKKNHFLIFPGAKFPERRWPPERFADVARFLHQKSGWIPIAVGASSDSKSIEAVIEASSDLPWERVKSKSIAELCELIASAQIIITNDSGPMHLAPALQVPTVAIVPGAEFTAYPKYPVDHPYLQILHQEDTICFDCKWNCTKQAQRNSSAPCLRSVSSDQVCAMIAALTI
jgi:ADP-heptose:LPS heptosyltransferase